MADDELRSAWEIALEKLRAREGVDAQVPLTEEQKARIAEIRARYRAKRAEMEILHRGEVEKARLRGDPEEVRRVEDEYVRELRRLDEKEDAEVRAVRAEGA
jgi:phage-related minor tail protein